MTTEIFNPGALQTYEEMLGRDKLVMLWSEYKSGAAEKSARLEDLLKRRDWAELRIIFHSLRSSSLVFGLDKFAELCTKIESLIVQGGDSGCLPGDIRAGKALLEESIRQADIYFRDLEKQ